MSNSTNNIKVSIGGPESSPGSAESLTHVVPIAGNPGLRLNPTKSIDPVVSGVNMRRGKIVTIGDVNGPLPLSPRACAGYGKIINSVQGQEDTPTQIAAAIALRYTGSEDSCKLAASASGDTLTSKIGTKGSESLDANFGTTGVIDLTAAATDTVAELVAVINAYDDYDCIKVFGSDATDCADVVEITAKQAANGYILIFFSSADSAAYLHAFPGLLTSTERPVYTYQIDGRQDNYLYTGNVADRLSISGALKGFVTSSVDLLGMTETGSQSAQSALDLPSAEPFRFSDFTFALGANTYTQLRNINIQIANNHNPDGYGGGSLYRQYQEKGLYQITGDLQLRLDSTSIGEKAYVDSVDEVGLLLTFLGKEDAFATDIHEMMLIEAPYVSLDDFDWVENNGVLDARIPFEVVRGLNSPYGDAFTIYLITGDSSAY